MKTLALLLVLLALSAPALAAQSPAGRVAATFGEAWRARDADRIGSMLAPDGIRLQLGSESHSRVAGRQARAAISAFLGERSGGRLELQRSSELGGEPPKGSAEFRWETVVQGTSEPVVYTIFVELTRAGDSWWVSEIRVF